MAVFDLIIAKFAPYDCLGCGAEGMLVCANCAQKLAPIPPRCYRCRKLSPDWCTCAPCRRVSKLYKVDVATIYSGVAKDLIWELKFHGAQAAAREIAKYINFKADDGSCLVPVPTATGRARRRGYDQAKLLARELARQYQLPYADCLRRSGQAHQVGASRRERLDQLRTAFRVAPHQLLGDNVILVDDVVTTGATLEAAAVALKKVGVRRVNAVVFAQP